MMHNLCICRLTMRGPRVGWGGAGRGMSAGRGLLGLAQPFLPLCALLGRGPVGSVACSAAGRGGAAITPVGTCAPRASLPAGPTRAPAVPVALAPGAASRELVGGPDLVSHEDRIEMVGKVSGRKPDFEEGVGPVRLRWQPGDTGHPLVATLVENGLRRLRCKFRSVHDSLNLVESVRRGDVDGRVTEHLPGQESLCLSRICGFDQEGAASQRGYLDGTIWKDFHHLVPDFIGTSVVEFFCFVGIVHEDEGRILRQVSLLGCCCYRFRKIWRHVFDKSSSEEN